MQPHLVELNHTTSTMDVARDLLTQGTLQIPTLVTAQTQESGRGRQGRPWISPRGNLYLSIVTPDVRPQDLSQYALMWGVILRQVLAAQIKPGGVVSCKWPNDVLVDNQKIAGLLIERYDTPMTQALIVGIGVNIAHAPEGVRFPATALDTYLSQPLTPKQLALDLFHHYQTTREKWHSQGFEFIRTLWMSNAWSLGRQVNIRQGNSDVVGVLQGINKNGAIEVLDRDGMLHTLYTGDVFGGDT